ncbi:MAG: class I SAM-dependent methyltransferase [Miltoncostaeaceae bacterium]
MGDTPDFDAIKGRQQKAWDTGDYAAVAHQVQLCAEGLPTSAGLLAGERVLDVAAGSGNASLAAARRGCRVTALDYVPSLLERARARAESERLPIEIVEGDAENLPFEDGSFDAVISVLGVMFAPNQEKAAAELARVCRPQGKIALVVWPGDDFVGEVFRTMSPFITPPPGVRPPFEWASAERLEELFGDSGSDIELIDRQVTFTSPNVEEFVALWTDFYGPTATAYGALDDSGKKEFREAFAALGGSRDTNAGSEALLVPARYTEVLIARA